MGDSEEYEGWKNRETWAVNLHLSNDEGLYNSALEWVDSATRDLDEDEGSAAIAATAERFKEEVTTLLDPEQYRETFGSEQPDGIRTMAQEVGSLWRVDWHDLAEGWVGK